LPRLVLTALHYDNPTVKDDVTKQSRCFNATLDRPPGRPTSKYTDECYTSL